MTTPYTLLPGASSLLAAVAYANNHATLHGSRLVTIVRDADGQFCAVMDVS